MASALNLDQWLLLQAAAAGEGTLGTPSERSGSAAALARAGLLSLCEGGGYQLTEAGRRYVGSEGVKWAHPAGGLPPDA